MTTLVLYVDNDMILRLPDVVDDAGDPITTATVELTELLDCDGNTPDGIALPLTLFHDSGGTYEAEIEDTIDVEDGDVYQAKIVVSSSSGDGAWFYEIVVRKRTGVGQ